MSTVEIISMQKTLWCITRNDKFIFKVTTGVGNDIFDFKEIIAEKIFNVKVEKVFTDDTGDNIRIIVNTDRFEEYLMHDQNEFSSFLKRVEAKGLVYIDASDEKPMVFLIECKHNVLKKYIESFTKRLSEFPKKLKIAIESDQEFLQLSGKSYVGVICGTKFLEEFSKTKGFIVVYPSGDRHRVEIPGELSKTRKL
ncbi:hypothetical protein RhiirA5_419972 [Rhizophagus irregularis]|uniref:Crinkler family protein n=1 Tax=Rhizophagus irregularis TaxID=588596 RepID=A0A2I1EZ87_9GLOM|nr:hypothetical protein RhiirA5_419972 [Rhizophagus irregularis]PKC61613.1 hypothetical protein RhiirA1_466279 [Rhizophagus irregularis]PKY27428.1 hypothetical protein RhiirB3_443143 [Rhizophagus irregularis]